MLLMAGAGVGVEVGRCEGMVRSSRELHFAGEVCGDGMCTYSLDWWILESSEIFISALFGFLA